MTTNNDQPQWIRWHQLPPDLTAALASGQSRLYLALHAYRSALAILAVPAADRISLEALETTAVAMTTVRLAPTCRPRTRSSRRASPSSQR